MNAVEIPSYTNETLVKLNEVSESTQQKPIFIVHNIYGTVEPLQTLGMYLC